MSTTDASAVTFRGSAGDASSSSSQGGGAETAMTFVRQGARRRRVTPPPNSHGSMNRPRGSDASVTNFLYTESPQTNGAQPESYVIDDNSPRGSRGDTPSPYRGEADYGHSQSQRSSRPQARVRSATPTPVDGGTVTPTESADGRQDYCSYCTTLPSE